MNSLVAQDVLGHSLLSHDRYEYDEHNQLVFEKHSAASDISYTRDSWGRPTTQQFSPLRKANGTLASFCIQLRYDDCGHLIQEINPDGNSTQTNLNARGQPISIQHPDGSRELFEYNLDGTLRSHTDLDGIMTLNKVDFLGRIISKSRLQSGVLLSEETDLYTSFHLASQIDAEGNTTKYIYDGAGRLIQESKENETIIYSYDSLGRRTCVQTGSLKTIVDYDLLDRVTEERKLDAAGQVLTRIFYEYDAAGRCTAIHRSVQGQPAIERFSYDERGRLQEHTDPLGSRTQVCYEDNLPSPLSYRKIVTDPIGTTTTTTVDVHQQVASVVIRDPSGHLLSEEDSYRNFRGDLLQQVSRIFDPQRTITTQWSYDTRGHLSQRIDAAGSSEEKRTRYSYSPSGRLLEMVKPDGVHLDYSYTSLGFVSRIQSSDRSIDYFCVTDRCGYLVQSTDGNTRQSILKNYDHCGRLIQETFPAYSLKNAYDTVGRRTQLILPDVSSIDYNYDALFLRSVTRNDSHGQPQYHHVWTSFDESGNLLEESLIGDLGSCHYSYDLCSRLATVNSPFVHTVVRRDSLDNILELQSNGNVSTYTYDCLSQLTSESGACAHQYNSDAQYCRKQKDGENYEINSLLQIPSHLIYDANGNPTKQGDIVYRYDALDRLISIETPLSHCSFTYDFERRRLSQTTSFLENGAWKEEKLFFIYDGLNEIGAIDVSGKIVQLRILGACSHSEIGAAISIELNDQILAPIHDLQGNVESLISLDTKQPTSNIRYSAFGEEQINGMISPWRFASKRTDAGLVYFGRRYYSPMLGRWLTPDPLNYTEGINRYAYVHNNPLNRLDEYGLYSFSEGAQDTLNCMQDAAGGVAYGLVDSATGIYSLLSTTGSVLIDTACFKNPIASWNYYSNQSYDWSDQAYTWMDQNIRRDGDEGIVFTISRGTTQLISDTCVAGKLTRGVMSKKTPVIAPKRTTIKPKPQFNPPRHLSSKTISPWTQGNCISNLLQHYENSQLTRTSIKTYLQNAKNLNTNQISKDLESIGLKIKGMSPDSRFMEFVDKNGKLRAKIHPSDSITNFDHMHIYDKYGRSLNSELEIVNYRSIDAHIQIKDIFGD